MAEAQHQPVTAATYWAAVEELATNGGQHVQEAVHSSLIEWFAWGSEEEKRALVHAGPFQGEATKRVIANYRSDLEK